MSGKALQIMEAERVLSPNVASWPFAQDFELKARNAFARVFSGAQAATRVIGQIGVSLAVIGDVVARALALLTNGMPPARGLMSVV